MSRILGTYQACDIFFNNTNRTSNSLKLVYLYNVDSYMRVGLSNAYSDFVEKRSSDNARKFNSCFSSYLNFQMFGNTYADTWLQAYIEAGLLSSALTSKGHSTAEEWLNDSSNQVDERKTMKKMLESYGNIYNSKYIDQDFWNWCNSDNDADEEQYVDTGDSIPIGYWNFTTISENGEDFIRIGDEEHCILTLNEDRTAQTETMYGITNGNWAELDDNTYQLNWENDSEGTITINGDDAIYQEQQEDANGELKTFFWKAERIEEDKISEYQQEIQPEQSTESSIARLEEFDIVDYGEYQDNEGDSFVYTIGQDENSRGNIDIDGNEYQHGLEAWIARWNNKNECSWAYATYHIGGEYEKLTGKTVLIDSYNTTEFDTTLYFYNADNKELLESYDLSPNLIPFEFSVNVENVENLMVFVSDNVAVSGGTSFGLVDTILE